MAIDPNAAAEAIRLAMRQLRVAWFVEDAEQPVEACRDMTPYMLLALAVLSVGDTDAH